jgi:hypothetical protein
MKRIFAHYLTWEDVKHGLYSSIAQDHLFEEQSFNLLSNEDALLEAMRLVVTSWPVSTKVNLTNKSRNRRSWLGQASCCLEHGANEQTVKNVWNSLDKEQQDKANKIADKVIKEFEQQYA